jgi:maleylpyruvate isomerase
MMTRLGDDAFRAPSLLPGWSRAHVLSHIARNADAMINLLQWARTGVETPAYASAEARDADIEEGAARPPGEIRADVVASSDRLANVVRGLPESAWSALVTNVQGRVIRASAVPWIRAREMWIHAVDLDAGASFADMPGPMIDALLVEAADAMGRKPECPVLRLVDGDHSWSVGEGTAVVVTGEAPELAAWLLGRSAGKSLRADGSRKLPPLPPWL